MCEGELSPDAEKLSSINLELVLLINKSAFEGTSVSIPSVQLIDAEFLLEIGKKYLKGDSLLQSVCRAIEMFSAVQRIGEQDADCDASLLSFNLSKTLIEHYKEMKWEREGDLERGLNKRIE